jgi:hypothetical protein
MRRKLRILPSGTTVTAALEWLQAQRREPRPVPDTRKASCLYAGVSEDRLERWTKRCAGFAHALTRVEAEAEVALVVFVRQAAQTDWHAGMELLSRRWPEAWGSHDRVGVELRTQIKRLAVELELDPPRCCLRPSASSQDPEACLARAELLVALPVAPVALRLPA